MSVRESKTLLIKYGGNAMTDEATRAAVLEQVAVLRHAGVSLVIVHGGGPAIAQILDEVGLESDFVGGHRRTDERTIPYVQMALRGRVNGDLVQALSAAGEPAVGLSGSDAGMVRARRRRASVDLGHVGDVQHIDTRLLDLLLENGYLPVVAPLALGDEGALYNVNADMFAGHLAAALQVDLFVALTDVDGLRRDPADAATVIRELKRADIAALMGRSITGGMIPKVEACAIALDGGVRRACIVDGRQAGSLRAALEGDRARGTEITA